MSRFDRTALKERVREFLNRRDAPPIVREIFISQEAGEERVEVSERDLLAQLFSERKISRTELFAGRRWQFFMQDAAIQPITCALGEVNFWQPDGEVTERQWRAINARKAVVVEIGKALASFLDAMLDTDVGRARLLEIYGQEANSYQQMLVFFLRRLAVHFGASTRIVHQDADHDEDQRAQNTLLNSGAIRTDEDLSTLTPFDGDENGARDEWQAR